MNTKPEVVELKEEELKEIVGGARRHRPGGTCCGGGQ
jgi:hypothetical protein